MALTDADDGNVMYPGERSGPGYADKALLIGDGPRLPEHDVKVTIGGRPVLVRVRGLSRQEALEVAKLNDAGVAMMERRMLALAMVHPRMTEGDVRQWQDAAPAGELEPICDKVQELSGAAEGSAKDIYREMAADPAEEFRLLPGDETRHDRGPGQHDA